MGRHFPPRASVQRRNPIYQEGYRYASKRVHILERSTRHSRGLSVGKIVDALDQIKDANCYAENDEQ